jgi:hypothetical protein
VSRHAAWEPLQYIFPADLFLWRIRESSIFVGMLPVYPYNFQPGAPRTTFLLSPTIWPAWLAWVTLPGALAPAITPLRIIRVRKPRYDNSPWGQAVETEEDHLKGEMSQVGTGSSLNPKVKKKNIATHKLIWVYTFYCNVHKLLQKYILFQIAPTTRCIWRNLYLGNLHLSAGF